MSFSDLVVAYGEYCSVLNDAVTQAEDDIWAIEFFGAQYETDSCVFDEAVMAVNAANSVARQLSVIWFDIAVFFGESRGINKKVFILIFGFINPSYECSIIEEMNVSFTDILTDIERAKKKSFLRKMPKYHILRFW